MSQAINQNHHVIMDVGACMSPKYILTTTHPKPTQMQTKNNGKTTPRKISGACIIFSPKQQFVAVETTQSRWGDLFPLTRTFYFAIIISVKLRNHPQQNLVKRNVQISVSTQSGISL